MPPCRRASAQRERSIALFVRSMESGFEWTHSASLSGGKRTWAFALHMSAFDPKRTYGSSNQGLLDAANKSIASAKPLRSRLPRSVKRISAPATKSFTVRVTRHSFGWADATTLGPHELQY